MQRQKWSPTVEREMTQQLLESTNLHSTPDSGGNVQNHIENESTGPSADEAETMPDAANGETNLTNPVDDAKSTTASPKTATPQTSPNHTYSTIVSGAPQSAECPLNNLPQPIDPSPMPEADGTDRGPIEKPAIDEADTAEISIAKPPVTVGIVCGRTILRAVDLSDEELDKRIPELYRSFRLNRKALGEALEEKQRRLTLAGCRGKFSAFLREINLPRSSAYEIIGWHKAQRELNTVLMDAAEIEIGWAKMRHPRIMKSLTEFSRQLNGRVPSDDELSAFFKPFSAIEEGEKHESPNPARGDAEADQDTDAEAGQGDADDVDQDDADDVDQDDADAEADQDSDDEAGQDDADAEADQDSDDEAGQGDADAEADQDSDDEAGQGDADDGGQDDADAEADHGSDNKPKNNKPQLDPNPAIWTRHAQSVEDARKYCQNLLARLSAEERKANPLLIALAQTEPSAPVCDMVRPLMRNIVLARPHDERERAAEIICEIAEAELANTREELNPQPAPTKPSSELSSEPPADTSSPSSAARDAPLSELTPPSNPRPKLTFNEDDYVSEPRVEPKPVTSPIGGVRKPPASESIEEAFSDSELAVL